VSLVSDPVKIETAIFEVAMVPLELPIAVERNIGDLQLFVLPAR
jgi:hypothetical protein